MKSQIVLDRALNAVKEMYYSSCLPGDHNVASDSSIFINTLKTS